MELLYSGVAMKTASAPAKAARKARHGLRGADTVVVLVIGRDVLQPAQDLDFDVVAEELGGVPEELRVERVAPEAARDCEDLRHRRQAAFTSWSSATIVTSFASAGSPVGRGVFQSTPKSVRSTRAESFSPRRSFPYASAIGSERVPVTSTGFVTPLIVISPGTTTRLAVEIDVLCDEPERGEALGVEEVGRLQVRGEVLVLHVHACDLRAALDTGAGVSGVELNLHVAELTAECAGEVVDLEADSRMDWIEVPSARRNLGLSS